MYGNESRTTWDDIGIVHQYLSDYQTEKIAKQDSCPCEAGNDRTTDLSRFREVVHYEASSSVTSVWQL